MTVLATDLTVADRFWAKVEITPTCWLWRGVLSSGYGQIWIGGRMVGAHRWSYEQARGPIPDGLELDHLCRVPACVNPAHLEPVTGKENRRRGRNHNRSKTHCVHGHAFDRPNTYITQAGIRMCRTCRRERMRRYLQNR